MNSKSLVFIAFAVWSAICWRWYVCNIKEACAGGAATVANTVQDSGIEAVDTAQASAIQPLAHGTATTTQPISASRINEVQIEEVEGHAVIHFPYNSIRKEDDVAIDDYLNRLAAELRASGATVTIGGHTDFVGDNKFNYQFGLLRANSIRAILIKKGVAKSQIKTRSYGETKAVATNDTPLGRYMNRRADIRIKN